MTAPQTGNTGPPSIQPNRLAMPRSRSRPVLSLRSSDDGAAYALLKMRLCNNHYASGTGLKTDEIARELAVSVPAVCAALPALAAERLLDIDHNSNFIVRRPPSDEIAALYQLNSKLLKAAASNINPFACASRAGRLLHKARQYSDLGNWTSAAFVQLTRQLFAAIAANTDDAKAQHLIDNISDRLHLARRIELPLLTETASELTQLCNCLYLARSRELKRSLHDYHARRLARVDEIHSQSNETALLDTNNEPSANNKAAPERTKLEPIKEPAS